MPHAWTQSPTGLAALHHAREEKNSQLPLFLIFYYSGLGLHVGLSLGWTPTSFLATNPAPSLLSHIGPSKFSLHQPNLVCTNLLAEAPT